MPLITTSASNKLEELVGEDMAHQMIKDAKHYLKFTKEETGTSYKYSEIAAEREIWKKNEVRHLSKEDLEIDKLAFISAAIELDVCEAMVTSDFPEQFK